MEENHANKRKRSSESPKEQNDMFVVILSNNRKENSFRVDCVYSNQEDAIKRAKMWASEKESYQESILPESPVFDEKISGKIDGDCVKLSWTGYTRVCVVKAPAKDPIERNAEKSEDED